MCLDRNCAACPTDGAAVFPCVSTLSDVTCVFAAEYAICRGRVPGAKSGLVFSVARKWFPDAFEETSRHRIHEPRWAAVCRVANNYRGHNVRKARGRLGILHGQWV